jgi:hypothetical protein
MLGAKCYYEMMKHVLSLVETILLSNGNIYVKQRKYVLPHS